MWGTDKLLLVLQSYDNSNNIFFSKLDKNLCNKSIKKVI